MDPYLGRNEGHAYPFPPAAVCSLPSEERSAHHDDGYQASTTAHTSSAKQVCSIYSLDSSQRMIIVIDHGGRSLSIPSSLVFPTYSHVSVFVFVQGCCNVSDEFEGEDDMVRRIASTINPDIVPLSVINSSCLFGPSIPNPYCE